MDIAVAKLIIPISIADMLDVNHVPYIWFMRYVDLHWKRQWELAKPDITSKIVIMVLGTVYKCQKSGEEWPLIHQTHIDKCKERARYGINFAAIRSLMICSL